MPLVEFTSKYWLQIATTFDTKTEIESIYSAQTPILLENKYSLHFLGYAARKHAGKCDKLQTSKFDSYPCIAMLRCAKYLFPFF